jgi:hypothetical protein
VKKSHREFEKSAKWSNARNFTKEPFVSCEEPSDAVLEQRLVYGQPAVGEGRLRTGSMISMSNTICAWKETLNVQLP